MRRVVGYYNCKKVKLMPKQICSKILCVCVFESSQHTPPPPHDEVNLTEESVYKQQVVFFFFE